MYQLYPRICSALALCFTLNSPLLAQSAPDTEAKVHTFTLKNGMTLLVKPDHRAPTAVHMLWLRAGAMDETSDKQGVAHVLEHMMFKGSKKVKPGEFSRRVAALGGKENAFTSSDYTAYFQQIPKEKLADVMALESDRFQNNQWSDSEFKKELEVVKEERRLRTDDNPKALLYEQLMAATYNLHPYRKPIIGWMQDLDNLRPEDARSFFKAHYQAGNAAIVVAGDVDPEQVRRLAEKYYAAIPAQAKTESKQWSEPEQKGQRRIELKAVADQAALIMAFKVPKLENLDNPTESDWDAIALTVLSAILDGSAGSRLEKNLIHGEPRLANSVGTSNGLMGRGPQLFYVEGSPAKGKTTAELETALHAQIRQVAEQGVSEEELKRVTTQWMAAQVYQRDSVFYQARELGSRWAQNIPLDADSKLLNLIQRITPAQVQNVAKKYFTQDNMTVATLLPQPRDPNAKPRTPPPGLRH